MLFSFLSLVCLLKYNNSCNYITPQTNEIFMINTIGQQSWQFGIYF